MAKEIVKINHVEAPTLFIGVGGTGCDIVKGVAEMCRPGETENISFVCLDTNVNDLSNIAQSKAHIYYVQTSNTQTVGDYLSYDEDAGRNWFPKNAVIYDKTVSEGAGQVRAISRLALNSTIKTGKIRPLYDAIDDLFRKDGKELKQALRIIIVSTSSGGTGSGIAMPLAMFVRDYVSGKYPNTSLIVRSLILLPETLDSVIDSAVERDSQRRNAYATIKEINAFMMKGSGFLDVESDLKRYGDLHIDFPVPGTDELRSLGILPFDFCFLMDGQDAEDSTLISLSQYKNQASQALYEQNIGPMQRNAFSVEDNIIKEMSNPGNFGRNRFGAIGASTIRYPYEQIADYVAYTWANDSIGGKGEASKWCRYDHAFDLKRAEARKQGKPMSEGPKIEDVYPETIDNSNDAFSRDLRGKFLNRQDTKRRISQYFNNLAAEMHKSVMSNNAIRGAADAANELSGGNVDYRPGSTKHGNSADDKDSLQTFEQAVKNNARDVAASKAESVFYSEYKTINKTPAWTLESLMRNGYDEILHPNAVRYMLYEVKKEFQKRIDSANGSIERAERVLEKFAPDVDEPETFTYDKTIIHNVDELCEAERNTNKANSKIYNVLSGLFQQYYKAIKQYAEQTAEVEAYKAGLEYVNALCKSMEQFYASFKEKVEALERKKDDLVNELRFRKGDSILNVCSSQELLEELSRSTRAAAADGAMLDDEVNAAIFDAVKCNVAFEREIQNMDIVEEDRRIDIFDDVLVGYFKSAVRRKCADRLDLNIIEAIAQEKRLQARVKSREESAAGEKVFDKVTPEEAERYIREVIAMGGRLAAPSVQRMRNVESREINLCAYNKSLLEMRNYRIKDLITKGNAVDSISRYELRFFNALYNLTPDKLNKFMATPETETSKEKIGLYHRAYATYAKDIGPDSTKGSKISTHIDKRWDSIAVMPELDFNYQAKEMMKIHQAMIYGLVYNAIQHCKLSVATSQSKMVYKYQNSEEQYLNLTVSNHTPCDEFYEILDSLYISSFVVHDMDFVKAKMSYRDKTHNSNYRDTEFNKHLHEFYIEESHAGPTSLFEIPVLYYASLPNSRRFIGEINGLVDAVIKTFEDELRSCESPDDVKFELCEILKEQCSLLVENYNKYEALNCGMDIKDNPVMDAIYRKIKNVVESTPEPSDYLEMIENMKRAMK